MKSFFLTPEQYSDLKGRYAKFNEPWTADETEELRQMAADGLSRAEMSAQLGRSPNAVKMKLQSLGLYVPKPAARVAKASPSPPSPPPSAAPRAPSCAASSSSAPPSCRRRHRSLHRSLHRHRQAWPQKRTVGPPLRSSRSKGSARTDFVNFYGPACYDFAAGRPLVFRTGLQSEGL